jgi:hypothetical protein
MKQQLSALLGVAAILAPIPGRADTYTPLHRVTEVAHCTRYAGPMRSTGRQSEIVTKNGKEYVHTFERKRATHVDACVLRSERCWFALDGDFNGAGRVVLYAPPVPARLRGMKRCNMAALGEVRNDGYKLVRP